MPAVEYGVVVKTFWTDPDVRALSRDASHLLLYYCTSPHSLGRMIGVYYCPPEYAAKEAKFTVDEVRALLAGPLRPHVSYDEKTEEVFVHAFAKYNVGEELHIGKDREGKDKPDHRIAGVETQLKAVHSPWLYNAFRARYRTAYHLTVEPRSLSPSKAPLEHLPSPLPSPSEAKAGHGKALHNSSEASLPAAGRSNGSAAEPSVTEGQVLATVRKVLWGPDGLPPDDDGAGKPWTDAREMTVIQALVKKGETLPDLILVCHGLKLLQDAGEVDWLTPGKVTLRTVYYTKNGSRSMLTQALDAYAAGPPKATSPPNGRHPTDVKRADFLAGLRQFSREAPCSTPTH
jgi:hypothetical protein